MPKVAPDLVMDAALDYIAAATVMHVCSTLDATPTYAEIVAASLANVAVSGADFTKADGDVSGRKTTVSAKSNVDVTASGTANHVALVTSSGTTVRYVTTCTSQAVTNGNKVNIPAWDIEIADPT